jgi:hypothetical protein
MKKLRNAVMAAIIALAMGGCSVMQTNEGSFVVQYATLKLLEESTTISATDVLSTTDKVRTIVDTDQQITLVDINESFRRTVDISSLAPSDQLLVSTVINRIQVTVAERQPSDSNFISIEQTTTILQLLDAVDEAAMLSGG